jgi:uncharacterized alkaline shock family protein YloU
MYDTSKIIVYGFVGPSGTGKSYRAQFVAGENEIEYIIDDGLFIYKNKIIAGISAKKAETKIETVKHALFFSDDEKKEIQDAIEKYNPKRIMILGTSDGMVQKIAKNLGLPEVSKIIHIEDVATPEEMERAHYVRITEGKHVIPVPTFEIKKDFSGYILDPLQIFKSKGYGKEPYMEEKSIIRPTFSYIGNFTISDNVFKQIIEYLASKTKEIDKINRVIINKKETGPIIYIETTLIYGYNIKESLKEFKIKCKKEIEKLTAMNIQNIIIVAKNLKMPEQN